MLLAGTGALLGLGATAAAVNRSPLARYFGQTEEQQALGEDFDRTAQSGKKIDRGLIESAFDLLSGRDYKKMEELAQAASDKRIKDTALGNTNIQRSTRLLKSLELSDSLLPDLKANTTAAAYAKQIEDLDRIVGLGQAAKIKGIDVRGLDEAGILQANADFVKAEKERLKTEKKTALTEQRNYETRIREEALTEAARIRADAQLKADKLRASNLQMSVMQMENNRLDSQDRFRLGQMDRDIANRRLDMEQANINQKNQMAAIATLMQGLQGNNQSVKPPRSYFNL